MATTGPQLKVELHTEVPLCVSCNEWAAEFPEQNPKRCGRCEDARLEDLNMESYLERDL